MWKYANVTKKPVKEFKKITLGICAMDKKSQSKPMKEILKRLPEKMFDIVIFGDDCILNKPIEEWPIVEVCIAFYSSHYPIDKAIAYTKLRKPFMVNDLEMDVTLKDRRTVYSLLKSLDIDVPFHVILERDDSTVENVVEEEKVEEAKEEEEEEESTTSNTSPLLPKSTTLPPPC